MNKKDLKYIIIFTIFVLLIGLFFLFSDKLFGSTTDWLNQHVAFPEYFRKLFYETKDFFPNMAYNIGSGQNIYNFSYYGLFNPIILISYLLPFIKMIDYMMIVSLINVLVSTILLYYFLKPKLNDKLSFICCLLFLFCGPIIFHSHRHLMFVNYMPFLILGLMGVDKYFKNKKVIQLVLSIFLMILTSYYYSIGGIVSIIIYGIYVWLQKNKFDIKTFIKDGILFLLPILIGVLLSAFLLLPTAYAMLSGRDGGASINIVNLFIPNFNLNDILYTTYSIGLSAISIMALFHLTITKEKANKFLGITLLLILLFPIFIYLLNGTLYVRSKVLIPFIPLIIYIIGVFLKKIFENKVDYFKLVIIALLLILLNFNYLFVIDLIILLGSIFLYKKYKIKLLVIIPLIIMSFTLFISYQIEEGFVKKKYDDSKVEYLLRNIEDYSRTTVDTNNLYGINKIYNMNQYNNSIYSSIYNSYHHDFYMNIFENPYIYRNNLILPASDNILFETLTGSKYKVSSKDNLIGYDLLLKKDNLKLYKNDNTYGLGYGTSEVISEQYFDKLDYPYNVVALLNNIVIKGHQDNTDIGKIEKIELLEIDKIIKSSSHDSKETYIYNLEQPLKNKVLLIDFEVLKEQSCRNGDIYITINGITNKLTCSSWVYKNKNNRFAYVISEKVIDKLEITFSKGDFKIDNINSYVIDYNEIKSINNELDHFDVTSIKGDVVKGNIDMKEKGYFTLTIPYDKGFKVYVDDKQVDYEIVNKSFIGFGLEKGKHDIQVIYKSPYSDLGKIISLISLSILIIYIFINKRFISSNSLKHQF